MNIVKFTEQYTNAARTLAQQNYDEECRVNPALPQMEVQALDYFANEGIGVAALENDKLVGFLCFYNPWDEMFGTHAKGTFSPVHAHGAVTENRERIYQKLYESVADLLVGKQVLYHGIALYANDFTSQQALFTYGFGTRCMDQIRKLESINVPKNESLEYRELALSEFPKIRDMRISLNTHLTKSPCFIISYPEDMQKWIERVENGDRRTFVAETPEGRIVAYLDVADEGETFVTEREDMMNLQGAYCDPDYRSRGVMVSLLDYVISQMKKEGYSLLGVDHESFNPTALRFWSKYFTPYTRSVVRRVDESI